MTEAQIQELQAKADLADKLEKENKALLKQSNNAKELAKRAARVEQLEKENAKLREGMDTGKFVPEEIPGTFKATWKSPAGKNVNKIMRFKAGHKHVRIKGGIQVSTVGLMQLANEGTVEQQYLEMGKALGNMSQEDAKNWLTHLTKIGYGYLEQVR